jgi:hypothetical protein
MSVLKSGDYSMKTVLMVLILSLAWAGDLKAACMIQNSKGMPSSKKGDLLFTILDRSSECPEDVQSFKSALNALGLAIKPYMVANRGIHNPTLGSFSFFEEVSGTDSVSKNSVRSGEFFFGHFTTVEKGNVVSDQEPSKGKLLIELIAWDNLSGQFNFYELIGMGNGAQWFYRGDSEDILADNALLYLSPKGPKFGSTLRCSGCHTSGGPIMKEMATPHNDWWTKERPLKFSPNTLSPEISSWVAKLDDASKLSQSIRNGIARLEASPQYQKARGRFSLQTTLRPLFCEVEINIESDTVPLDQALSTVAIPSSSMVNPLLAKGVVGISTSRYKQLLVSGRMKFPETDRRDADHGWLVPVKGYSDFIAIQKLIDRGTITEEFVADVLAVDFENPLFSSKRCGLLKLIPLDGLENFPSRLKSSALPGASELYENLTDPSLTGSFHRERAQRFIEQTQLQLKSVQGQTETFKKLIDARRATFNSEISKNPLGQILEPGFRVIFPEPN